MSKIIREKKYIDGETGEIVTAFAIIPEAKDKNFLKIFPLMSKKVIDDLKKNGLNGAANTLWWIIDHLMELAPNKEPIVLAHPENIANDIGGSPETIRKHLKKLKDLGYIEQVRNNYHLYRANPEYIFKGTLVKYFRDQSTKIK